MTRAGRRLLVCCALTVLATVLTSCRFALHRASSASGALTSGVANTNADAPAPPSTATCPLTTATLARALGEKWTVASLASGGCTYTDTAPTSSAHSSGAPSPAAHTIQASTVPLPADAAGRSAALVRLRNSCTARTLETLSPTAFVCQQDTLVEGVGVTDGHLLVVCTPVSTDPKQLPAERKELAALLVPASPASR